MSFNSSYQTQIQSQDFSQLQKQKQDLVHCNNSFGMLLSSMESLLIKSGYGIKALFGHYNHFNDLSWKTREEIKAQLNLDLMAYKIQKMTYKQKYKKFDFPDYPPIEEIIKIIEKWKQESKEKELQKLCDDILDLIKDENEKPISFYQARVEKTKTTTRADPVENVQMANKIHNIMDKRNEEVNKKVEDNKNAKFGLIMGGDYEKSEFSGLKKDDKKKKKNKENKKGQEKLKKEEKKITKKVEELLESISDYVKEKKNTEKTIQKDTEEIDESLEKYFKENDDIDFLFEQIHKEETIKKLDKYIKSFEDSIKLIQNVKAMLTSFDER